MSRRFKGLETREEEVEVAIRANIAPVDHIYRSGGGETGGYSTTFPVDALPALRAASLRIGYEYATIPPPRPIQDLGMVVKRRFEEPKVGPIPDSMWGNDWFGDDIQFAGGGRQDVGGAGTYLSVVGGTLAIFTQGERVPSVVPVPPPPPPLTLPPPPPGPTEPPMQGGIPVSWRDYLARGGVLPADWNNYPMASDHPSVGGVAANDGLVTDDGEDMGILGDIYDIVDTAVGGVLPGGVDPFWAATAPPLLYNQPGAGVVVGGGGAPGGAPPMGPPAAAGGYCGDNDPYRGMVWKRVCGQFKWVKQKRGRRKSLATKGDIQALSSLKGVLGNGKALESWIATHS